MERLRTVSALQAAADAARVSGRRIAVVPTMGALHRGHTSLITLARQRSDVVVTTVFVNPTQFGPREDLSRYPRDLERDARLAGEAGTDILFAPSAEEMYGPEFQTVVTNTALAGVLEGKERPGHYQGVATIVAKLLLASRPHVAVFGQKDAQQAAVIRALVRDLNFGVEIVVGPIVRDPDGLALSSRNAYLTPDERRRALAIFRSLAKASELVRSGERSVERIRAAMEAILAEGRPERIDYIAFVDPMTFRTHGSVDPRGTLAVVTARFGSTRLLDNILLMENE